MTNHTPTPFHEILKLTDRLRGKYVLSVNDGAGLLDGKDTFTREWPTVPIQTEAADMIDALAEALKEIFIGDMSRDCMIETARLALAKAGIK